MTNISTLRPGLLVSLKTSLRGNVKYNTSEIEADHLTSDGERVARWETERKITDPAEHEKAIKVRGRCRTLITGVCAGSAFGLLCPESKSDQLDLAIREARKLADAFNAEATCTSINVYVIAGRVASDDVEALRAIHSELCDLFVNMEAGVRALDAGAIREAANKARDISAMLTPAAAERVQEAINVARKAARVIVKAGEQAASEIDKETVAKLAAARTAFLDLEQAPVATVEAEADSRAIDFESFDAPAAPAATQQAEIEF